MPGGVIVDTASQRSAEHMMTLMRLQDDTRRIINVTVAAMVEHRRDVADEVARDGHRTLAILIRDEADDMAANSAELVSRLESEFAAFVTRKVKR